MKRSKFIRASSLVEFALVLPILMLVLFGIIQYGFIFAAYITVRNASAVGAREAIINSNQAVATAQAALSPMLDSSKGTSTLTPTTLVSGVAWNMTVSYPLPIIIPYVVPSHFTNKLLTATTIIR